MKTHGFFVSILSFGFVFSFSDPMGRHMTVEQQDRTGVSKLQSSDKEALAQWMDDKKGNTPASQGDLMLTLNINQGEFLRLNDGSIWQIGTCCRHTSRTWLTRAPITVSRSNDSDFPYYLENMNTGERVLAHHITHLPYQRQNAQGQYIEEQDRQSRDSQDQNVESQGMQRQNGSNPYTH